MGQRSPVKKIGLALALSLLLAGCTEAPTATPVSPPSASPVETGAPTQPVLTEDAEIRLDSEPRLVSPTTTLVPPDVQTYTLTFREPMQRDSVEQAISKHLDDAAALQREAKNGGTAKDGKDRMEVDLTFAWTSDTVLKLTAAPKKLLPSEGADFTNVYRIQLTGALTQSGKALDDRPLFRAVVTQPDQLYRYRTDGTGAKEQVSRFNVPYTQMRPLDAQGRHYLLYRPIQWCQCDADYGDFYTVYEPETGKMTPYEGKLYIDYMGPGDFVADRRGFFYQPNDKISTEGTVRVKVEGYVHGANFSRDGKKLLLALGDEKQEGDYDLAIYDLDKGEITQRLPGVLTGGSPFQLMNGTKTPVVFTDDGQQVTLAMMRLEEASYLEFRHRYNWQSGTVTAWHPPVEKTTWSGYTMSDDRQYRLFANSGLYKGDQKVADGVQLNYFQGQWVHGTHLITQIDPEKDSMKAMTLRVFDADAGQYRTLANHLPQNAQAVGSSPDGKYVYVKMK